MDHKAVLEILCRVCGRIAITKTQKTKYNCTDFLELSTVFGLSVDEDDPLKHPAHFCHACKIVMGKAISKPHFRHQTSTFEGWCTHHEEDCTVCNHFSQLQRGGRRKKMKTPGRPPHSSPRFCVEHIQAVAPPRLTLPAGDITICELHLQIPLSELNCPICYDVFNSPIELVTCGNVVCADCACKWLETQNQLTCPCCYNDHLEKFSTIRAAPPLVIRMIESLCVVCRRCSAHLQWKDYNHHVTNSCQPSLAIVAPHSSIDDLLHQPVTAPLTPIEQKLQTSLARRSLTEDKTLQLRTGGKVRQ